MFQILLFSLLALLVGRTQADSKNTDLNGNGEEANTNQALHDKTILVDLNKNKEAGIEYEEDSRSSREKRTLKKFGGGGGMCCQMPTVYYVMKKKKFGGGGGCGGCQQYRPPVHYQPQSCNRCNQPRPSCNGGCGGGYGGSWATSSSSSGTYGKRK